MGRVEVGGGEAEHIAEDVVCDDDLVVDPLQALEAVNLLDLPHLHFLQPLQDLHHPLHLPNRAPLCNDPGFF